MNSIPACCAQRLSASQTIPQPWVSIRVAPDHACSTPFGITDYSTGLSLPRKPRSLRGAQRLSASQTIPRCMDTHHSRLRRGVLNAFRHHRLFHCAPPECCRRVLSAQRLSASQTIPPWPVRCSPTASPCAQRLSASQTIPPGVGPCGRSKLPSRCSTPFGITDYSTPLLFASALLSVPVLNAFRHHRLFHRASAKPGSPSTCAQRLSASQTIPP